MSLLGFLGSKRRAFNLEKGKGAIRAFIERRRPERVKARIQEAISLAHTQKKKLKKLSSDLSSWRVSVTNLKEEVIGRNPTNLWDVDTKRLQSIRNSCIKEFRAIYKEVKRLKAFQKYDTEYLVDLAERLKREPKTQHTLGFIIKDEELQKLIDARTIKMDRIVSRALDYFKVGFSKNNPWVVKDGSGGLKYSPEGYKLIWVSSQLSKIIDEENSLLDEEITQSKGALEEIEAQIAVA